MANRRKFLAGLGALASGSAAAMGTGAFTSVQAERDITIEAVGDASAYLAIEPFPTSGVPAGDGKYGGTEGNGEYASETDGVVSLNFTSNEEASGTGLNDKAMVNIEDVLLIKNNGTQPVYVTVQVEDTAGNTGTSVAGLSQFGISGDADYDFGRAAGSYDGDKLPAGESAGMGFYFNSDMSTNFEDVVNDIDKITIIAAANKKELKRWVPSRP